MPRRFFIAVFISGILHVLPFAVLILLYIFTSILHIFGRIREPTLLSSSGGVIWFNLDPGGSGTGGSGGADSPPQEQKSVSSEKQTQEKPAKLEKRKPSKQETKSTFSNPIKENSTHTTSASLDSKKEDTNKTGAAKHEHGEGDGSGPQTGSGQGEGLGLGQGQGTGMGSGEGPGGPGPKGTGGSGSGGKAPAVLAQIRRRVLRAKYYPPEARREGMEGTCGIQFEINRDGSLRYAKLTKSSGYPILDEAALRTMQRATPFPYYAGPIQFNLKFSLKEVQ